MTLAARRPIVVAANWKMHKTAREARAYLEAFWTAIAPLGTWPSALRVVFFPPATILSTVVESLAGRAGVGAQNCHWEPEGAFTGELSAPMIAATGAEFVLVGHSERRHGMGETDEQCASKIHAALDAGLTPVLCVGETLEQRDRGRQRPVVLGQLARALDGLSAAEYGRLAVAYEPVWAIGTGRTARPIDAQEMHAAIREALGSIGGPAVAGMIPILYGGSVKPDNAAALLTGDDVDGALVGGASLDPQEFTAIVIAACRAPSLDRRGGPR